MGRIILNKPPDVMEGGIIKITTWKNSTYQNMPVASGSTGRRGFLAGNSISFTKEKGATESYMFVTGIVPGQGMPNYPQIGCCCTIDDLYVSYTDTNGPRTGAGGGGSYYLGPDQSSEGNLGLIHKSFREWDIAAGAHTLTAGWNANSNVRPFIHLNPNSSIQNRHHQCATHICIYEVSKTS